MISEYTVLSSNIDEIDEKYPLLSAYKESLLLKNIDASARLGACFLTLAFLSELILTREDLTEAVGKILRAYYQYLPTIRGQHLCCEACRMCFFLQKYILHLFKKEEDLELFQRSLYFLVQQATSSSYNKSSQPPVEQANQSLYELLTNEQEAHRIPSAIIIKFLESLKEPHSMSIISTLLLDVVREILHRYKTIILEHPKVLSETISKLAQFGRQSEGFGIYQTPDEDVLDKVWSILNVILSEKEYAEYKPEVDKITSSLLTQKKTTKPKNLS